MAEVAPGMTLSPAAKKELAAMAETYSEFVEVDEGGDSRQSSASHKAPLANESEEDRRARLSQEVKDRRASEEKKGVIRKSVHEIQRNRELQMAEEEEASAKRKSVRKSQNSPAIRLLRRSLGNEINPPDESMLLKSINDIKAGRKRSSELSRASTISLPQYTEEEGGRASHATLLVQMAHNLKPKEEDLQYLQRRILFPGIFEQESSDEEDKPKKKVLRPICPK